MPNNHKKKITAVDVYLKKRKTREYVGQLTRDNKHYIFTYDNLYLYKDRSIPLGPDCCRLHGRSGNDRCYEDQDKLANEKERVSYGDDKHPPHPTGSGYFPLLLILMHKNMIALF